MVRHFHCSKCHSDNVRQCVEPGTSYWICKDCSPKYTEVYDANNLPVLNRDLNPKVLFSQYDTKNIKNCTYEDVYLTIKPTAECPVVEKYKREYISKENQ